MMIIRCSLQEDCGGLGREIVDFDVALVVVGNENFIPSVVVQISEREGSDSTAHVFNGVEVVSQFAGRCHNRCRVVTISSNQDVSGLLSFVLNLGPELVRESRGHVRYQQTELILKVGCERRLHPRSLH